MDITFTQQAAKQVAKNLERRGSGLGIRLGTKTTGCSGLAYVLEYVDKLNIDDHVIETGGIRVVVSNQSLVYLKGLTVDYVRKGLNEGF